MSFDFSTLITDRTQADVNYAKALAAKISAGTASEAEIAEFNGAALRGAYSYTDLNRVTAAMESLKAKLEGYGYNVPGYQRIKIKHNPPPVPGVSRLPDGYLELAYIKGAGTQYIDTNFKPNNNTRVVLDIELPVQNSYPTALFGGRNADGSRTGSYATWLISATQFQFDFNTEALKADVVPVGRFLIDKDKSVTTLNGTKYTNTASTFQTDYSLTLFTQNDPGGPDTRFTSGKLYSCQIYNNGKLTRDFVPCINPSGDVGLFDVVTQQFYGNAGTGVFIAGDRVNVSLPDGYTRTAYIESDGAQYIDTGFKPSNNTRVVMDAQLTSGAASQFLFGTRTSSATVNFNVLTNSTTEFRSDYGESKLNTTAVALTSRVTVDKNKNVCKINSATITNSTSTFQCSLNLFLFAANNGGSAAYFGKVKHYSCQIYDNGTLVRNFVPCRNANGVCGLYDLANGVFYQNAGGGSFAAGEEVSAPATASVAVVSDNVADYDSYTWYEFDVPTSEDMTIYLLNVSAFRSVIAVTKTTPSVPADMVNLMAQEANDIEKILKDINLLLINSTLAWYYSGDLFSGEV